MGRDTDSILVFSVSNFMIQLVQYMLRSLS